MQSFSSRKCIPAWPIRRCFAGVTASIPLPGAALRTRFHLDEHNCVAVLHHEVDFAVLRAVPPRPHRHALPGQRLFRILFSLNPGIVALHFSSTGTKWPMNVRRCSGVAPYFCKAAICSAVP